MSVVSGRPTVYDATFQREDPLITLLKQVLGKKTVVEKAPDAGFRSNEQVYPTSGPGIDPPGKTLGAAPADRGLGGGGGGNVVVDASTDYGSLNEFKSELGKLSAPTDYQSIVGDWLDNLPVLLNNGGFEGREIGVQTDRNNFDVLLDELNFLQGVYEKVLRANEGEIKRYRSANEYYAAMAESAGVSSYETVLNVLKRHGVEEVLELKQDILAEFNKLVRDKAVELTMREVKDASTQLALDSRNPFQYQGANAPGAKPGLAPTQKPPMLHTGAKYSVKQRAGRFENPRRSSSSSSGNTSGESFDPKRPDTSKAFDRPGKKKTRTKKK